MAVRGSVAASVCSTRRTFVPVWMSRTAIRHSSRIRQVTATNQVRHELTQDINDVAMQPKTALRGESTWVIDARHDHRARVRRTFDQEELTPSGPHDWMSCRMG